MAIYRARYQLLYGMLLTSYWHGNSVSACLDKVQNYDPEVLVSQVAERGDRLDWVSTKLAEGVAEAIKPCLNVVVDPEMVQLRDQLQRLRAEQSSRPN